MKGNVVLNWFIYFLKIKCDVFKYGYVTLDFSLVLGSYLPSYKPIMIRIS